MRYDELLMPRKLGLLIDKKFWSHISINTLIPHKRLPKRSEYFFNKLSKDLRNGLYSPNPPRDYLAHNKGYGVARIVPLIDFTDLCVYYLSVKLMEDEIAINRVEGTFGGFRLGGQIRRSENDDLSRMLQQIEGQDYSPSFSLNIYGWIESWSEFQKMTRTFTLSHDYKYFVKFDIANFYDNINFSLLENKLRHAVPREKAIAVEILMYYLSFWNKDFKVYAHQLSGLPQDEVGDCSRILSNFFLQDYDTIIKQYCNENNLGYLRFADDQIIGGNTKKELREAILRASIELAKIGLNINVAKTKYYTNHEFDQYWCFEIFELLTDKEPTKTQLEKAIKLYLKLDESKSRKSSVAKRLLSRGIPDISEALREKLVMSLLEVHDGNNFIDFATKYHFERIYEWAPSNIVKAQVIDEVASMIERTTFNKQQIEGMNFLKSIDSNIISETEYQQYRDRTEIK